MSFLRVTLTIFYVATILFVQAQSGSLRGQIKDQKTGDAMIGATIMMDGKGTGTTTDFEGNFEMAEVPAGMYKIIISSIGYASIVLDNVRIEAGKETIINTSMTEESLVLEAVEVRCYRNPSAGKYCGGRFFPTDYQNTGPRCFSGCKACSWCFHFR